MSELLIKKQEALFTRMRAEKHHYDCLEKGCELGFFKPIEVAKQFEKFKLVYKQWEKINLQLKGIN